MDPVNAPPPRGRPGAGLGPPDTFRAARPVPRAIVPSPAADVAPSPRPERRACGSDLAGSALGAKQIAVKASSPSWKNARRRPLPRRAA